MDKMSRRDFFRKTAEVAGIGLLTLGCTAKNTPPAPRPAPESVRINTPEAIDYSPQVKAEIQRLVGDRYNLDKQFVKKIYSGTPASDLSSVYKYPNEIGQVPEGIRAYSRYFIDRTDVSDKKRFSYTMKSDNKTVEWQTIDALRVSLQFSKVWLDAKSDEVKSLALEKEAMTAAQFDQFCKIAYNTYDSQGRIQKIDPSVRESDIGHTFGLIMLTENPNLHKLFDYAGYLPILERAGKILESSDTQAKQDLARTNIGSIYTQAKEAGIPFKNVEFGSQDFYKRVFNDVEGPWAKMILNPRNGAPPPPSIRK